MIEKLPAEYDDPQDSIKPVLIEHLVDEYYNSDGSLSESYNYLDYYFERDGWRIRARAYADEFGNAQWFPPSAMVSNADYSWTPQLEADVAAYLARRFAKVRPFAKQ